jgi:two-component system NtrC family sensor kinase
VRARRDRETLARQLKQTNDELQQRVRELTTIFAIGKAVTSITNQQGLFEKIVEGAMYVTEAEMGWLLLRDERSKAFLLAAQRNLPKTVTARVNSPWDDGISSLVAMSGETLTISGEPIMRFKVSQLGRSALVTPVKVKKEVVGLLVVVRKEARPFSASNRTLLEAVADYASISMVNARLFQALEERARSLQSAVDQSQASERRQNEVIDSLQKDLMKPVSGAIKSIESMLFGETTRLNAAQKNVMRTTLENLQTIAGLVETLKKGP